MKICCNTTTIPSTCPTCDEFIDACCVFDSSAISCLDISANTPQCEINRILAQAICDATGGGDASACYDGFNDLTLNTEFYPWIVPSGAVLQYSNPVSCQVRLRGVVQFTTSYPFPSVNLTTPVFSIPSASSRPLTRAHAFSVTVGINGFPNDSNTLLLPGLLTINTAGLAYISITNIDPYIPIVSGCSDCNPGVPIASLQKYFNGQSTLTIFFSVDGVTFEVFP